MFFSILQLPPPLQFHGMSYPLYGFLPGAAALAAATGANPAFSGNPSQSQNIPLQMYMPPNVNAATLQQALQLQAAHAIAQAATNQNNAPQNPNASGSNGSNNGIGGNGNINNSSNGIGSAGFPVFPPTTLGLSNAGKLKPL